jgi:hypothetical protein
MDNAPSLKFKFYDRCYEELSQMCENLNYYENYEIWIFEYFSKIYRQNSSSTEIQQE